MECQVSALIDKDFSLIFLPFIPFSTSPCFDRSSVLMPFHSIPPFSINLIASFLSLPFSLHFTSHHPKMGIFTQPLLCFSIHSPMLPPVLSFLFLSISHPSLLPSFPPFFFPSIFIVDIRLRVRAEYSEHESVLRGRVSSDKQQPLERQFELFSRASMLLRARDLGSIVCDIKFSELANLDAFWADYLSGALLEALKGVFITDSLKRAAGQEGVRLLVSVDQDDYEEGRRLLLSNQTQSRANSMD